MAHSRITVGPRHVSSLLAGTIVILRAGESTYKVKLAQDVKKLLWVGVRPYAKGINQTTKQVVPIHVSTIESIWVPEGSPIPVTQEA